MNEIEMTCYRWPTQYVGKIDGLDVSFYARHGHACLRIYREGEMSGDDWINLSYPNGDEDWIIASYDDFNDGYGPDVELARSKMCGWLDDFAEKNSIEEYRVCDEMKFRYDKLLYGTEYRFVDGSLCLVKDVDQE